MPRDEDHILRMQSTWREVYTVDMNAQTPKMLFQSNACSSDVHLLHTYYSQSHENNNYQGPLVP